VGRAASVLSRRVVAFVALAVALGAYYATHESWFALSLWRDLAWLAFVLIPAVFALVWFALPLRARPLRQLLAIAVACAVAAVLLEWAGAGIVANFAKLATMTFVGWSFLWLFEELSWVVLVACIIPWVDAYSVFRGPTKEITQHHEHVFFSLSFEFPVPGTAGTARLGLPDLLFFALFLGAAARWQLRTGWTWVCLTASIGGTMALATLFEVDGLPALPLLALGFLVPNADLLWRAVRGRAATGHPRSQR
jgi:hypothetical protein